MLFTGDIEAEGEEAILKKYADKPEKLKACILKVAHHGSKTSSTENFIETVKPEVVLIGVGKNNLFNHPNQEVLKRFKKLNVSIYRTDKNGEIVIRVLQHVFQQREQHLRCVRYGCWSTVPLRLIG